MICPNCGTNLPYNCKFCGQCGIKLEKPKAEKKKKDRKPLVFLFFIVLFTVIIFGALAFYFMSIRDTSGKDDSSLYKYDEKTKTLTILSEDAMFNPSIDDYTNISLEGMENDPNFEYEHEYDQYKEEAEHIEFNDEINNIASFSFNGFTAVKTVSFPSQLTRIGANAFEGGNGIEELVFPNSLRKIGNYAFASCHGLQELVIPDSVELVGLWAFTDCNSLKVITVKGYDNPIGMSFEGCDTVEEIYFDGDSQDWQSGNIGTGLKKYTLHCADGDFNYSVDSY